MNIIKVHHRDVESGKFVCVANIRVDEKLPDWSALEYAWRWTNNIEGSWSRRDLQDNSDANEAVEVTAPLHVKNGKTYGLRSSMMGDIFTMKGKSYEVAMFGFHEVKDERV